jgi:hypothetical protein
LNVSIDDFLFGDNDLAGMMLNTFFCGGDIVLILGFSYWEGYEIGLISVYAYNY